MDEHLLMVGIMNCDGRPAANGRAVEIDASRLQSMLELARVAARRLA